MMDPSRFQCRTANPVSFGWVKHPTIPNTWEEPDGTLYQFPPGATPQIIVKPSFTSIKDFEDGA